MDSYYIDSLCMNCFHDLNNGSVCENCGFDNDTPEDAAFLPMRSTLSDRYIVGRGLNSECDALTYIGFDSEVQQTVTIREFFPHNIANRFEGIPQLHVRERYKKDFTAYKQSFINLWQTLKDLNPDAAVIPVNDIFEDNGTVYVIIKNIKTVSMHDFLLQNADNLILWDKARLMFMPILTTIETLHSHGIIHGGITPDNMLLCSDGKVRLTGFCIPECNAEGGLLQFNNHPGYTALEQYDNNHKICRATDIYGFSACLYRALSGSNPPDAQARQLNDKLMISNRVAEKIPTNVIRALGGGLQIYPEKRVQEVDDLRELLNVSPAVVAKAAQQPRPEKREEAKPNPEPEKKEKQGIPNSSKVLIIIIAVLLVITIGVYIYAFSNRSSDDAGDETAISESVQVPDFCTVGYTKDDIEESGAWNAQFDIDYEEEYSTDTEEGVIFKQSIAAGETVEEGTNITLTVSKGHETATVPDVSRMSSEDATELLQSLGFEVEIVKVYNDGSYAENTVKIKDGTTPAAGELAAKGSTVLVQVYDKYTAPTGSATTEAADAGTGE